MSDIRVWLDDSQEDHEIVSRHFTLELGPVLGFGSGGCVYALRNDPTRAVKFARVYKRRFDRECKVAAFMHQLGVGPRVYDHFTLRARATYDGRLVPVGVLVMERLETTLFNASIKRPWLLAQLWPEISQKIRQVAHAGYCLDDLHPHNVMLHQGRVYFIDFECVPDRILGAQATEEAIATMSRVLQRSFHQKRP